MEKKEFINMPKLLSPFEREDVKGNYVCVPRINDGYRWIFTEECIATEKFDGTNVSILVNDGKIVGIYNRLKLRRDMFAFFKGERHKE